MKTITMTAALAIALAGPAWAQETPEDDELTPAAAMELLKEAHELMGKAEELLNDSSRGKALETEKDLLAKLEREFKDIPAGEIMKKIGRVVEKAEKREQRKREKAERPAPEEGVDPDIAGIVPGPQPPLEW